MDILAIKLHSQLCQDSIVGTHAIAVTRMLYTPIQRGFTSLGGILVPILQTVIVPAGVRGSRALPEDMGRLRLR